MDTPLTHADSIVIARSPADLYDMVADVTRMGEWSPVCKACWWDDGAGPSSGAWFTGRNDAPGRDPWETRSQVVAAVPGEEFAFVVGGTWTRWGYTFTPAADGPCPSSHQQALHTGLHSPIRVTSETMSYRSAGDRVMTIESACVSGVSTVT